MIFLRDMMFQVPPPRLARLSGENTTGEHCCLFSQEGARGDAEARRKVTAKAPTPQEKDFAPQARYLFRRLCSLCLYGRISFLLLGVLAVNRPRFRVSA